jgi:proteasome activator subunit 4
LLTIHPLSFTRCSHLVLYQYLLSPEDHANCAVLLFRIFELDGIDETLQERTAAILRRLLKKKDLMASTAIIVQWRPLYDLMTKYFFCKLRRTSEVHRGLGEAIVKLIKESRRFFTPESTTEIMNELSPLLCPHDEVCFRAAGFLSLLLPTNADAPAATSPAFVGWFEQLFAVWAWVRNTPDWDFAFVQLFSRLAKDNFGKQPLGWQPHLPWLFNKILSMLNIPVGSSGSSTPHQYVDPLQSPLPPTHTQSHTQSTTHAPCSISPSTHPPHAPPPPPHPPDTACRGMSCWCCREVAVG